MIPSIRIQIDQANNTLEPDNGGLVQPFLRPSRWRRLPASQINELHDFRRRKHTQQIRDNVHSILQEMEKAEAKASANLLQIVVNEQRPFGLPRGKESPSHIWEKIFDHVHDVGDIANLRDTCVLFRDLLEAKYKIIRLNEAMLKFGSRFGGLETLLALRQVCRSTKTAVDHWIKKDRLHFRWHMDAIDISRPHYNWMSKPQLYLISLPGKPEAEEAFFRHLRLMVSSLMTRNVPDDSFPIRRVFLWEGNGDYSGDFRRLFQQFLQLAGSSIRSFSWCTIDDNLGNYNQLRNWVGLMPNLEDLLVRPQGNLMDWEHRPALPHPFPAFPACPNLKRFVNSQLGMRAAYVEQIFLANPWINGVCLGLYPPDFLGAEEVATIQRSLASLQFERFNFESEFSIPRDQFLEFRFTWPLKSLTLSLTPYLDEQLEEEIPTRTLFNFVNSFSRTLEELTVTWKLRDTGGFLDLPNVKKLLWKLWPDLRSLDFTIALESLEYLDVDVTQLQDIIMSLENARSFINDMNLPPMFPALRQIRTKTQFMGNWSRVWTH